MGRMKFTYAVLILFFTVLSEVVEVTSSLERRIKRESWDDE